MRKSPQLVSRRRLLSGGATVALSTASLSLARSSMQRETRENPLGERWPDFSPRYFTGVGDMREMQRTFAAIEPGDISAFRRTWTDLAGVQEGRAQRAAQEGYRVSARDYYLRACLYFSFPWGLFLRLGDRDGIKPPHRRLRSAFQAAWRQVAPPFERIEVEFEDGALPLLFFRAPNSHGPNATVVEISGIDHIKERAIFRGQAQPFLERGLNYATMEGPGQGELLVRGIAMRPDAEKAGRAALEYLRSRPDVDPDRIGIFGTSFGAYFALRTAASDRRLRALACRSTVFDALEEGYDFCPWIRRHLELLLLAPSPQAARERLRAFNLEGAVENIDCPAFLSHGGRDKIISVASARRLQSRLRADNQRVLIVDEAGHFPGAEVARSQIDWIAARLR